MLKVMIRLKVTESQKERQLAMPEGGREEELIIVMLLCFKIKWMDFDVDHYEQWLILFGTALQQWVFNSFHNFRLNYSVENSKSFAVDKTSKCWNLIEFKCLLLFRICFSYTWKTRNKSPEKNLSITITNSWEKRTINNIYQTCQITKQNIALIVLMCAHNIAIVVKGKKRRIEIMERGFETNDRWK